MAQLFSAQLRSRARSVGAEPLVTYYDVDSGERTELSAISFLNWVDKTSNLLSDELKVEPGDRIALPLARFAPGHWVTLIWYAASWQVGTVAITGEGVDADDRVALEVLGPDQLSTQSNAAERVACSLHPLGMGFSSPLPAGIADFALAVRGQSDFHAATPVPGDTLAWIDAERQLSQNAIVSLPSSSIAGRVLVRPSDPWSTAEQGLIVPVMAGGSAVIVVGDADEDQLSRIAASERVDLVL